MINSNFKILTDTLNEWNINISDKQIEQFNRYYELLISWNEKINLTAITELNDVIIKHFLDSVSIVKINDLNSITSLIDIGTGAGFPGIPIKILFPNIKVVLLDSLNKRVDFLNLVINDLGLDNISAIHGRAEDFARMDEYREQFDLCVSRAVANISTLSELCIPFIKLNGSFISYKSNKIDEELDNCKRTFELLNSFVKNTEKFSFFDNERVFLEIVRKGNLDKKYPRRAGIPAKKPLG